MIIKIMIINVIKVRFIIVLISSINEIYYFDEKFAFIINYRELFEKISLLFISRDIFLILLLIFNNINVNSI